MDEGLRAFDNVSSTIRSQEYNATKDDEFDTPDDLYYSLISRYKIAPELDVFSTTWYDENDVLKTNSKCINYFTIEDNAFEIDWLLPDGTRPTGIWWNNPHTKHQLTLEKSKEQWLTFDLDILGIIPANTIRTSYFYPNCGRYMNKGIIIEPVFDWSKPEEKRDGYINFLKRGDSTEHNAFNGYLAIRYFSKHSWTEFIKYRIEELRSYP